VSMRPPPPRASALLLVEIVFASRAEPVPPNRHLEAPRTPFEHASDLKRAATRRCSVELHYPVDVRLE